MERNVVTVDGNAMLIGAMQREDRWGVMLTDPTIDLAAAPMSAEVATWYTVEQARSIADQLALDVPNAPKTADANTLSKVIESIRRAARDAEQKGGNQ